MRAWLRRQAGPGPHCAFPLPSFATFPAPFSAPAPRSLRPDVGGGPRPTASPRLNPRQCPDASPGRSRLSGLATAPGRPWATQQQEAHEARRRFLCRVRGLGALAPCWERNRSLSLSPKRPRWCSRGSGLPPKTKLGPAAQSNPQRCSSWVTEWRGAGGQPWPQRHCSPWGRGCLSRSCQLCWLQPAPCCWPELASGQPAAGGTS